VGIFFYLIVLKIDFIFQHRFRLTPFGLALFFLVKQPDQHLKQPMNKNLNSPELAYLSPTTRERAIMLAQQLINSKQLPPTEAIRVAILQAKDWAIKSVNRTVWKRLRSVDKDIL
jgi:hypothetical protein